MLRSIDLWGSFFIDYYNVACQVFFYIFLFFIIYQKFGMLTLIFLDRNPLKISYSPICRFKAPNPFKIHVRRFLKRYPFLFAC